MRISRAVPSLSIHRSFRSLWIGSPKREELIRCAHVELKEVFAILAHGVAREEEMEAAGASKEAIVKEWLPRVVEVRQRLVRLASQYGRQ